MSMCYGYLPQRKKPIEVCKMPKPPFGYSGKIFFLFFPCWLLSIPALGRRPHHQSPTEFLVVFCELLGAWGIFSAPPSLINSCVGVLVSLQLYPKKADCPIFLVFSYVLIQCIFIQASWNLLICISGLLCLFEYHIQASRGCYWDCSLLLEIAVTFTG